MKAVTVAFHSSASAEAYALASRLDALGYAVVQTVCEAQGTKLGRRLLEAEGPVLLLVNDELLHAEACQTGLLDAWRDLRSRGDVHAVMASSQRSGPGGVQARVMTNLSRVSDVMRYMNFWQNAYLAKRRQVGASDDPRAQAELAVVRRISEEIGQMLRIIRNEQPTDVRTLTDADAGTFSALLGPAPASSEPASDTTAAPATESPSVQSVGTAPAPASEVTSVEDRPSASDSGAATAGEVGADAESQAPQGSDDESNAETAPSLDEREHDAAAVPESAGSGASPGDRGPDRSNAVIIVDSGAQQAEPESSDASNASTDAPRDRDTAVAKTDLPKTEADTSSADVASVEENLGQSAPQTSTDVDRADSEAQNPPRDAADEAATALDQSRAANLEIYLGYLDAGGRAEAQDFAEETLAADPQDLKLRYALAVQLLADSEDDEDLRRRGETHLQPLFETEYAAAAHLCLGQVAMRERDFGTARRHLTSAYRANKRLDPELSYRIGALIMDEFEEDRKVARRYLRRAWRTSRDHAADVRYRLGSLEFRAGRLRRAVQYLKSAVKLDVRHPLAAYELAVAQLRRGREDQAARAFELAIQVNPELDTEYNRDAFFPIGSHEGNATPLQEGRVNKFGRFVHARDDGRSAGGETSEDEDSFGAPSGSDRSSAESSDGAETQTRDHGQESRRAARQRAAPSDERPAARERQGVSSLGELAAPEGAHRSEALTVLITGASSGIGAATARAFAAAGHRLVLTGRRVERLRALASDLKREHGSDLRLLSFDVSDITATVSQLQSLRDGFADIDVLVNNAGKAKGLAPIHEGELEHWEEMIDVNIRGLLYMTRLVSPGMVKRGRGHIINVCSTAGHEVYPNGAVYCATKHAVDAITRGTRLDLFRHGIRVSQISPAAVEETEFSEVRFDGDAERAAEVYADFQPLRAGDVAEAIVFIATRPPHVNIQDLVVLSAQQANSTTIDRSGRE